MRQRSYGWCLLTLAAVSVAKADTPICVAAPERAALHAIATATTEGAESIAAWLRVASAERQCGASAAALDALARATDMASRIGDGERTLQTLRERIELAATAGLPRQHYDALLQLGELKFGQGLRDTAATLLRDAAGVAREHGWPLLEANALSELSRLERRLGHYLEALRLELEALALRRREDPPSEEWRSLGSLAVLYEQIELTDEARRYYADALVAAERSGDPLAISGALTGYAGFLNDFGDTDAAPALAMAQRAHALLTTRGSAVRRGSALLQVGRARYALGQYEAAAIAYEDVARIANQAGSRALRAHVDLRRGELALARGDAEAARALVDAARSAYTEQGNRHRLIKTWELLERVQSARGDRLGAAEAGREHYRLRNELLGAGATGRLGELLNRFALAEERLRLERLARDSEIDRARREAERRTLAVAVVLSLVLAGALALLAMRHREARRLNALLAASSGRLEAAHAALSQRNVELQKAASTDSLTGLSNRPHALAALDDALLRQRADGRALAVMLVDIDHFKAINDAHGHPTGDAVLRAVAATMASTFGNGALVARWGGEEFLVVAPGLDRAGALFHAELLRRRVRESTLPHDGDVVATTVSIGICHPGEFAGADAGQVLRAADQALYAAKHAGRDSTRVYAAQAAGGDPR